MTANPTSARPDDLSSGSKTTATERNLKDEKNDVLTRAFQGFRTLLAGLNKYDQLRAEEERARGDSALTPDSASEPVATAAGASPRWEAALGPLHEQLEHLAKISSVWHEEFPDQLVTRTTATVHTAKDEIVERIAELTRTIDARFEQLEQRLVNERLVTIPTAMPAESVPPAPDATATLSGPAAAPANGDGVSLELLQSLFGEHVGRHPDLSSERNRLLDGLIRQDPNAGCFVGYLLLFQFAAVSERPRLLRPLGESFYRWCPKDDGDDEFENAVIGWVNRRCQQVGVPIRVEAVSLNCRFDAERHHAQGQAGRDVTDVLGWVVRTHDKVFDRATVGVR